MITSKDFMKGGIMVDLELCDKVGICPTTKVLKEIRLIKWENTSE